MFATASLAKEFGDQERLAATREAAPSRVARHGNKHTDQHLAASPS
jgi:hypothetical protein